MGAEHKVTVQLVDTSSGEGGQTTVQDGQKPTEPVNKSKQTPSSIAQMLAFDSAKKMVLGIPQRIGDATGNYMLQREFSQVVNTAQYMYTVMQFGIAGFVFAGVDLSMKAYDQQLQKAKQEFSIDRYRESVGMASASGTRYRGRRF
jgi:hypothetical protein